MSRHEEPIVLHHERVKSRRDRAWSGFHAGMLFSLCLSTVMVLLANSAFGNWLSLAVHNGLHGRLRPARSDVVVLDVSGLPDHPKTPRAELGDLVEAVAAWGPAAIGIDIDLSSPGGPASGAADLPAETEFLERLLAIRERGVPVFVGVHRSELLGPGGWLHGERYAGMATNMWIADDPRGVVPAWIQRVESPENTLWGLGIRLAAARAGRSVEGDVSGSLSLPAWSHWLFRPEVALSEDEESYQACGYLLDCSALDHLIETSVAATMPGTVADMGSRFSGKVVLIGRADLERVRENSFVVPGRRRPFPGVYLHACAVVTALDGFLFLPTRLGRLLLDLFFAVLALGGVLALRLYLAGRFDRDVRVERVNLLLTWAAVAAAFVVGFLLVPRTRLLWDGFVLVACALLAQLPLEKHVHVLRRRLLESVLEPPRSGASA